MTVPLPVTDGHKTDARLNELPRNDELFGESLRMILVVRAFQPRDMTPVKLTLRVADAVQSEGRLRFLAGQ